MNVFRHVENCSKKTLKWHGTAAEGIKRRCEDAVAARDARPQEGKMCVVVEGREGRVAARQ